MKYNTNELLDKIVLHFQYHDYIYYNYKIIIKSFKKSNLFYK